MQADYRSVDTQIDGILNGLRSPIAIKGRAPARWTLAERMEYHHVPGISMAIIDQGQIVWSGAFGVREAGTHSPVDRLTLFQAASISKPVAATAVLGLADAGKLSLDVDVNTYLRSWKVPDNEYTAKEKVTLRRILSHSAGLTVHGFPGYSLGKPVPTLQQVLDGEEPANTARLESQRCRARSGGTREVDSRSCSSC